MTERNLNSALSLDRAALSNIAMQNVCGVSCEFRFSPTLGLKQ